ncbi:hypothetical protein ACSYDW_01560 [Paeniglutamicibacter sp. R2-26]|uniref:hypothetical protein n=1 Tax=Paeniglutamicibacter sp. R2-26 TaxID=3144417 RepID=UPI003EE467C3
MEFDFTLRELFKIALVVVVLVIVGCIVYFAVTMIPQAVAEFTEASAAGMLPGL